MQIKLELTRLDGSASKRRRGIFEQYKVMIKRLRRNKKTLGCVSTIKPGQGINKRDKRMLKQLKTEPLT